MHRFWQASGHWIHGELAASQDCRSQVRGRRIRGIVRPIFLQGEENEQLNRRFLQYTLVQWQCHRGRNNQVFWLCLPWVQWVPQLTQESTVLSTGRHRPWFCLCFKKKVQIKLLPLSQSCDTRKPQMLTLPVTQTRPLMQTHSSGHCFGVTSHSLWNDSANASHIHATSWLETWGAGSYTKAGDLSTVPFFPAVFFVWFFFLSFSFFSAHLLVCGAGKMKHSCYFFFPASIRGTAANTNFLLSTGC